MRRLSLAITAVLTLSGAAANAQTGVLPAKTTSADLPLGAGEAFYMSVGGAVRDVVVADPTIADVSIVNERTLVVMGKRAGVTTLMAFGAGGRTLTNRQVVVSEVGDGGVTIYRGATANSYACGAARCMRVGAAPGPASGTP
ncbi:pilus assembly protein N-terminal domain-containing protein [Caulobacter sp. UC70_42]|uniref:pilus assembly protein N-terminal domain-containing protein n=1 Tax=Caulobacter sp. UC70_42 TaxID=3374551 RepID=UPI003756813E